MKDIATSKYLKTQRRRNGNTPVQKETLRKQTANMKAKSEASDRLDPQKHVESQLANDFLFTRV